MKTLRTAIIGMGRIGWQYHAPEILKQDGFQLVAVADPLEERLKEAAERWGVKGYQKHEALLAAEKPDLVVIASPTPFHVEQTLAAFNAGCDVFCDKPMAPTLADVDQVIHAMEMQGRKLMVFQPHRATEEFVGLRHILAEGLIGDIYMIKRACSSYVRRNDWQAFKKNGGGMLNNYGSHYIDQLLNLAASPAKRVSCSLRTVVTLGDADDVVKATIETNNGILLDIDINMATAYPITPWQVFGKRGTIIMDEKTKSWRVRYVGLETLPPLSMQAGFAAEGRRYHDDAPIQWQEKVFPVADFTPVNIYQRCYEYFALGQPPFVPIAETRELMRVLAACSMAAG